MPKKTKKITKKTRKIREKTKNAPTFKDNLPKNHGEWLELCIKFTERAIDSGSDFLIDQLWRLQVELEEWREENA